MGLDIRPEGPCPVGGGRVAAVRVGGDGSAGTGGGPGGENWVVLRGK